jgi:redox-sensitive bicupin YhaK (pirin superfamily)
MLKVRKSNERGPAEHGWLSSKHSFSFADYYDPAHMGFRDLRVINEDWIDANRGFPMHPHRDMEILTYVVQGSLAHKDSGGNAAAILPGEVQRMSAGTGVLHSEFNPEKKDRTHLLQIWILPKKMGVPFSYAQKDFTPALSKGGLTLVASEEGRDGSISINQDVDLYAARPRAGASFEHALRAGRHGWLQLVKGDLVVNGVALKPGDAVAASGEPSLKIEVASDAEFLLFDLN